MSAYYEARCRFETARMDRLWDSGDLRAGGCSGRETGTQRRGSGAFEWASEPSEAPVTPVSVFGPEKVTPGGPFDPQAFAEATRLMLEATGYLDRLVHLTRRAGDGGG